MLPRLFTYYFMKFRLKHYFLAKSVITDRKNSGSTISNCWPDSLLAGYPHNIVLTVHASLLNCYVTGRLIFVGSVLRVVPANHVRAGASSKITSSKAMF